MRKLIVNRKSLVLVLTAVLIVFGTQGSYGQTLTASTPQPLTEINLDESIVTLTLSDGIYTGSRIDIGRALTVSGIEGVTTEWHNVERISNTEITVELEFEGDFDVDATLTFTLGENALANYNGPALTTQIPVSSGQESIVASTASPLTETTLHGSVVTLTLSDGIYTGSRIDIGRALTVSGIEGVTTEWHNVERISNTEITVELEFEGDFDVDATLTFTLGENALASYNGPALTTQIPVSSGQESIVASTASPLTEATLHGSVVTLTLSGRTFAPPIGVRLRGLRSVESGIFGVKVSGISGLTIRTSFVSVSLFINGIQQYSRRYAIDRISDTELEVELAFDGNIDSDTVITFTVGAEAIIGYKGPDLTTEIPVTVEAGDNGDQTTKEDVNGDGVVNIQDLVLVASSLGQTGETDADVNGDGVVNIQDLVLVAGAFGDAAAAPSLHSDALEQFTVSDVQLWLSQARQRDLADPRVRKGILFLEQLLASMVPKETVLLANFPNPFNPETWIPYHLAKDTDVTLHIYAVDGHIVRTLALGHEAAGLYQSRSRAAYWDGRNAVGEPVASGLYFYTLTAGDFSATRKMLILK